MSTRCHDARRWRLRALKKRERIRRRVWWLMEIHGVATFPFPIFGRVPNFVGAERAACLLSQLPEFQTARCIYCTLDHPLQRLRELVLLHGKILAVALPRMQGMLEIKERRHINVAASVKGFQRYGKPLSTPVDLFVLGSVAVDRNGHRLGVGKGFTDREWRWLRDNGLLQHNCKIATIVHPLQIVDDITAWAFDSDMRVDIIVTPDEIIRTR